MGSVHDSRAPSGNATLPSEDGRRLLLPIIDSIAISEPTRTFVNIPRTTNPRDGWKPLTFAELANGINTLAHTLDALLGPVSVPPSTEPATRPDGTVDVSKITDPETFPTVAYIGAQDARYVMFLFAAIKTHRKALLISPRNSPAGQLNLFAKTGCTAVFRPREAAFMVDPLLEHQQGSGNGVEGLENGVTLRAYDVPSVNDLVRKAQVYPYKKNFPQAEWDPLVVLHTSGSTGLPKPIVVRQGAWAIADSMYHSLQGAPFPDDPSGAIHPLLLPGGKDIAPSGMFIPMPLFHAAGLACVLSMSVYGLHPCSLGVMGRPMTAEGVMEALTVLSESGTAQATVLPAAIVEELSYTEEGVQALKRMELVFFGGSAPTKEAGDRLVEKGVSLNNVINSTECFPYMTYLVPSGKAWECFWFHPTANGLDFKPLSPNDNIYEMFMTRKSTSTHPGLAPIFYTFPDLTSWSTRDLYRPHPTLPNVWSYFGRADDIIVFSSGEKMQPRDVELLVGNHESLKSALVVGEGRLVPGLVVEPAENPRTDEERESLINDIWPLVENANKDSPSHAQIGREYIIVGSEEKPFAKTAKGTVQKAATAKLYALEVEVMYQKVENGNNGVKEEMTLDVATEEDVLSSVMQMMHGTLAATAVADEGTDFFAAGVDSMQVIRASRLLAAALKDKGVDLGNGDIIAPRAIYAHPTPRRLAAYVFSLAHGTYREGETGCNDNDAAEIEAMKKLLAKYTVNLPRAPSSPKPPRSTARQTILLTGTTGSLGTALLASLMRNPSVARIICLNRASDGGRSKLPAVPSNPSCKTIFFHQADLSAPKLGLPGQAYDDLLRTVDTAIHIAWPVNFNIPLSSFVPHITGVRNLIDLAAAATKSAHIVFISSITEVNSSSLSTIPESALPRPHIYPSARGGYGRSKVVSSLLLDAARERSGVSSASIRVGQIAGARTDEGAALGSWSKAEWLPSIIASSVYLGLLPDNLGGAEVVDWVPIEDVVGMIGDVAGVNGYEVKDSQGYFHCVNPCRVNWTDLAPAVAAFYGPERIERVVGFGNWVQALEASASQAGGAPDLERNPGVKLLDTYRAMLAGTGVATPTLSMERTAAESRTVQEVGPITKMMVRRWCQGWKL